MYLCIQGVAAAAAAALLCVAVLLLLQLQCLLLLFAIVCWMAQFIIAGSLTLIPVFYSSSLKHDLF